jgi:hypothetical protein
MRFDILNEEYFGSRRRKVGENLIKRNFVTSIFHDMSII